MICGADPANYAWAAQQINALLRSRANTSATDWLQLRDFAALSSSHHTTDPDNWFISDNLHLNEAGRQIYTTEIVQGALGCP